MAATAKVCYSILVSVLLWAPSTLAASAETKVVEVLPVIIRQPNEVRTNFYSTRLSKIVLLPCIATGSPAIQFRWQHNGKELPSVPIPGTLNTEQSADYDTEETSITNDSLAVNQSAYYYEQPPAVNGTYNGSLVVIGDSEQVSGAYQCFASLTVAPEIRAISQIAYIHGLAGRISSFVHSGVNRLNVAEGQYLRLPCPVIPSSKVHWAIQEHLFASDGSRTVLDDTGTLHILSVMTNGSEFGGQLHCEQQMNLRNDTLRGRFAELVLDTSAQPSYRAPSIAYATRSPKYIANEDRTNTTVYCIAEGNPTPVVAWTRADKRQFSPRVVAIGPLLVFSNANQQDSGKYVCLATNHMSVANRSSNVSREIVVDVQSKLRFYSNPATYLNVAVGDSVPLDCRVQSNTKLSYKWFFNGNLMSTSKNAIPSGAHLQAINWSSEVLQFAKVAKQNKGVYLCNISNNVDFIVRSFAVNVFNRTRAITALEYIGDGNETSTILMQCNAEVDSALQADVYWQRRGTQTRLVGTKDSEVSVTSNGSTVTVTFSLVSMSDSDRKFWTNSAYDCVVQTWFSSDSRTVAVATDAAEAPQLMPGFRLETWLVIVLSCCLLLALSGVVALVLFLRRYNQGGTYMVDVHEREHGYDPVLEILQDSFEEYVAKPSHKTNRV